MRWVGRKLFAVGLTLLCGMSLAGVARALSFNVADIGNDFTVLSGDGKLEFSRFEFFLPSGPSADFTLTLLDDGIQLTGPMSAADGDYAEFYFLYQVSAVDPNAPISGVSLFAPSAIVDELYPTFAKTFKSIFDGTPGEFPGDRPEIDTLRAINFAGQYTEFDDTTFDPRTTITVMDGVRVNSAGPGDSAEVFGLTNRFAVVPEPGSIVLLGGGLLGLAITARRSRR